MPTPPSKDTATLLVCCPDCRGIAAAVAQVSYGNGADILDANQQTVAFS